MAISDIGMTSKNICKSKGVDVGIGIGIDISIVGDWRAPDPKR